MSDLISRQAAIEVLDVLCQEHRYKIPGKRETYSQYNEAWQDALDRAEGAIFNLPSSQPELRWIPCSERLPEYMTQVLVQLTHTGDIFVGALVPNVEGTYTMWDLPNFSSYICLEDVIAWMPLPKPYKTDEVEE